MSVRIGQHTFWGPHLSTDELRDWSGVYAIMNRDSGSLYITDVGESDKIKTAIERHDRKECWKENRRGPLSFAVYYSPDLTPEERRAMEREIRGRYRVPCGENFKPSTGDQ